MTSFRRRFLGHFAASLLLLVAILVLEFELPAKEDGLDTLPARAAEANRSTLIADIPFPAPENVAAKRCASEKRAF